MKKAFIFRCSTAPFLRMVLCEPVVLIGRSAGCDFVLDDPSISRRHAEIRPGDHEIAVCDLASRNGTFIDGTRMQTGSAGRGQSVKFGNVAFSVLIEDYEFYWANAEEETTARADPSHEIVHVLDQLSRAQRRVFDLLLSGFSEKTIAERLYLSRHTVHTHTKNIFIAFGVHSRGELLANHLKSKDILR